MVVDKNRINVSVSAPCLKDIDKVIDSFELFNGHADFVFTAFRNFYVQCTTRFKDYLDQSKEAGKTPLEVITLFYDGVENYGKHLLDTYASFYPGQNSKQIIIRPKDWFHKKIEELSVLLFNNDDNESLIKTCRIAIFWYLGGMNRSLEEGDSFEEELEELRSKVENNKIDLGI